MTMHIFKPIRWKTFLRDFIIIQAGFALFGLSIAILIRANLGTSPWVMLTIALSQISGLTPGTMSILIGFVVLAGALILREQIGWGTLGNILFIGPWLDLWTNIPLCAKCEERLEDGDVQNICASCQRAMEAE